jgi:hypothetical protein
LLPYSLARSVERDDTAARSSEPAEATKKVSIVEFKRAYNVSIALAQFKQFPTYNDLLKALYEVCACMFVCMRPLPVARVTII